MHDTSYLEPSDRLQRAKTTFYDRLLQTLPKPEGKQADVVFLDSKGHSIVLGAAGSGKTTMALWRAAWLINPKFSNAGKTLLLTYNRALTFYLKSLTGLTTGCTGGDFPLTVETYHTFALGYLHNKCLPNEIEKHDEELLYRAITAFKSESKKLPTVSMTFKFVYDEFKWASGMGYLTREAYLNAKRKGRGIALDTQSRDVLFDVFEKYWSLRAKPYEWYSIATGVRQVLEGDASTRLYKHIIVDEGQDLSPEMLRSLVLAVPDDGSLTFFGDMAQQIYGKKMSWKDAGFKLPSTGTVKFAKNYRNSPQIIKLAQELVRMPYFVDTRDDLVDPVVTKADGPLPVIARAKTETDEVAFVGRLVKERYESETVAVLIRRRIDEAQIKAVLPTTAIRLHRDMNTFNHKTGAYYGTYHSAKGMEFDTVILPFFSDARLPDPKEIESHGLDQAQSTDGKLVYVAMTRARTGLVVSYTGTFTDLLQNLGSLVTRMAI